MKGQKPNLEGFAMFNFIVFQLFAPHQAQLDAKKPAKRVPSVSLKITICLLPLFIQSNYC